MDNRRQEEIACIAREELRELLLTACGMDDFGQRDDARTDLPAGQGRAAGFQDCMVITQMINDGDEAAIEYPNGRVECAEVLGG